MTPHIEKYKSIFNEFSKTISGQEWVSAKILVQSDGELSTIDAIYYDSENNKKFIVLPSEVIKIFENLRNEMGASKGKFWHSSLMEIGNDGNFSVDFDYDTPPEWMTQKIRILE